MSEDLTKDELILQILIDERENQRAIISEQLVREIYDLQRRYQFESDRDLVVLGTKRAVEAEVDRIQKEELS